MKDYHDQINKAVKINRKIDALEQIICDLLDPVLSDAIKHGSVTEIISLLDALPAGFHRSELRAHLISVQNKDAVEVKE